MGGGHPLLCAATCLSAFKANGSTTDATKEAVTMIAAPNETFLSFADIAVGAKFLN